MKTIPSKKQQQQHKSRVAMFSSCRSRRGHRAKCANVYQQLDTSQSESVRRKLEKMEQYQPLAPRDMREKIKDLTEMKRLKDWFDDDEGAHTDRVSVTMYVHTYSSGNATSSTVGQDRNGTLNLRRKFEQFCEWGVISDVSLKVNKTILKWDATELIEPHLEALLTNDDNAAGAVCSRPETKEIYLGKSSKLNELLDLITMYNERHSFHHLRRNSKTFVCDALNALGIACPQILSVFEDYTERVKQLRSPNIPEEFDSPIGLSHYVKQNFQKVLKSPHDIEYLYFTCTISQVTSKGRKTSVTTARECSELECCLQDLDSAICQVQGDLIFHQFWIQFRLH